MITIGDFPFTYFDFQDLQYEIWNPYSQSIEIRTPNQNLINVSATFQPSNVSLDLFIYWGAYNAPNTFLIKPGLIVGSTMLEIGVNSTDLDSFPLGYYTFWIDLDFHPDGFYSVVSFSTYVTITSEGTLFSQDLIPPTWGETIYTIASSGDSVSSTSMTLIIVLLSFISLAYLSKQKLYP